MPFSPPILRLRPIALLASALQLLGAASARAQSEEPSDRFYGTLEVTAVELILDVRDAEGGVPADLGADDFRVLEDGRPVTVVGFEPLRQSSLAERDARPGEAAARAPAASRSWHVVAYFDTVLSSSRSIRRAAEFLASQAGRLTDLGTVQIVVADSEAQVWLQPTRSARLVEQTLQRMARELTGRDAMRRHRKSFLATLQEQGRLAGARPVTFNANRGIGQRDAGDGPAGGAGGGDDSPVLNEAPLIDRRVQVRWGATQELAMLRGQHDLMMAWLGRDLGAGPRALLVVNDGYDLEPQRFYLTSVSDPSDAADLYSLLQSQSAAPDAEQLARSLASRGWVAINLALGGLEAASSISAEQTGQGRLGEITAGNPQAVADLPTALVFQPLAPLNMAADATGGETLTGLGELPRSLDRLAERFLLTYQVQRTADGGLHRIEVHAQRPGLEVRTQRWSGTESLESVASARARRLLDGGIERGDLPLIAALALDPEAAGEEAPRHGRLQVRLDLRPVADSLAGFASASLRFTLAASFADGEPFVRHQAITGQDLAGLDAWTFTSPVSLPASIEKVAVVFEILDGGAWGGSLASLVQGGLPAELIAPSAGTGAAVARGQAREREPGFDLLPGRKAILLLPLDDVVLGTAEVATAIGSPEVARVEFRLDGRTVAVRARAPFDARVDFGDLPEPRLLSVIAWAEDGRELGRDSRRVNEGLGSFRTRIIEPLPGRFVGAVDVEAEVKIPADRKLDSVEFYWNGELAATVFDPPYRQRIRLPLEPEEGFLTAIARLSDGRSAEDVVVLNGQGRAERIDVELVELFTVVTDAARSPVRGLDATDFRVFEDGGEQALASFQEGAQAPLALGLLIDTSASMLPVLREVQGAAIDFALLTLRPQDRALVVGFGAEPRLLQPLSDDRNALVETIRNLAGGGWSPLTDSIVFAVAQMQQVPGRRALVLITDGVGREEGVSFATCQRFVEKGGIPLYVILLAGDDPTVRRAGGRSDERLAELVARVGGRIFSVDDASELGEVYRTIREELGSQYLLTYQPPRRADDAWRSVAVEVAGEGLEARTIRGYYP